MKSVGRFFSAHIDGKGKFAETASIKEPDLKWMREGFAGGGMVGEVEVPMILEAMKAELTLFNYDEDAINLFGIKPSMPQKFQFRRELFDTKTQKVQAVVVHIFGTIDLEFSEWDRKKLEGLKVPIFVTTYRRWLDGVEQFHIDPEAGTFDVDGVNAMSDSMRAIGRIQMTKIMLSKPVNFGDGKKFEIIELRDMTAGDFMDVAREIADGASRMEQEVRCAAKCSDIPYAVFAAMHPADIVQFSTWYDKQWELPKADTSKDDAEDGDEETLGKAGSSSKG